MCFNREALQSNWHTLNAEREMDMMGTCKGGGRESN